MTIPNCKIIAIILAAGQGKRYGCPKIRAEIDGLLFAEHIINSLQQAGIYDYKIIVSHQETEFTMKKFGDLHTLTNHLPDSDMFSSVKIGLQECLEYDGIIVWPVDHPLVKAATLEKLISTFKDNLTEIVKPEKDNKGGHPIILPQSFLSFVSRAENNRNLKDLITSSGLKINCVEIEDEGVLKNLNYKDVFKNP